MTCDETAGHPAFSVSNNPQYWKDKLQDLTPVYIPTDYPRTALAGFSSSMHAFELDAPLTDALRLQSREQGTTLFMTLLGVYQVLLYRYSGQEDICVGGGVPGDAVYPLRLSVQGAKPWVQLLQEARLTTLEACANRPTLPEAGDAILLQTMLFLRDSGDPTPADVPAHITWPVANPACELALHLTSTGQGLSAVLEYNAHLFGAATIARMAGHFIQLVTSIAASPQARISSLRMLPAAEEEFLIYGLNAATRAYNRDETILDWIQAQVIARPYEKAAVFDDKMVTYSELWTRSGELASYLRTRGIVEEVLVPLCISRSFEMVIGILGILRAGGAYVPIDPAYPEDRVRFILDDTGASMVLTSAADRGKIARTGSIEVVELDSLWPEISRLPQQTLPMVQPGQLVYMIYTSGSTGRPKGTLIEHRGVVNMVVAHIDLLELKPGMNVLQFASFGFDASCVEVFTPLASGGCIVLCKADELLSPHGLERIIHRHKVDWAGLPPSYQQSIRDSLGPIRQIISAGEAMNEEITRYFQSRGIRVFNGYGPTENTVCVSITAEPIREDHKITIGKPVPNVWVYLLDQDGNLTPPGGVGEICVGGIQVGRGYWKRPELTVQKFVPDPFRPGPEARLYRTGDLGRWFADGSLEYIGRADDQVKIRGYRVEPGEIEQSLQQCAGVRQAVVLAKGEGQGRRLVAYVVPEGAFNQEALVTALAARVPHFMIPSLWIRLDRLPLTAHGKVNKSALPEPDLAQVHRRTYVAPANNVEQRLSAIWQEILHVGPVGIHDNFFELGGHSLLAIRMVSMIRKVLGIEIAIGDIFTASNLQILARILDRQAQETVQPPLVQQARPERIPLSFNQERLWFIDQLEGSQHYHLADVFRIHGPIQVDALRQAFRRLITRHEALRTAIREHEGRGYQQVLSAQGWDLAYEAATPEMRDPEVLRHHLQVLVAVPFDLSRDVMLRAGLIALAPQEHVLWMVTHHIASDGWSGFILLRELAALYESCIEDRADALPSLALQYADYALWQRNYLVPGPVLDKKLAYWKNKLHGVSPLQLPTDYPRPSVQRLRGSEYIFEIDASITTSLRGLARERGVTLFMTLLSAFDVLLYRYSGQEDICVGSASAGRAHHDLEMLAGFFVDTLALRSRVEGKMSFLQLLDQVRTTTLEAYEHGDAPFEKVVDVALDTRDHSRPPLFQVMLVLQNAGDLDVQPLGEATMSRQALPGVTSKFEITLNLAEAGSALIGQVEYSTDLYDAITIARMMGHFVELLRSAVAYPGEQVGRLRMLSAGEEEYLVHTLNDSSRAYNPGETVLDWIQAQAEKNPGAVALVYGEDTMTYGQMWSRSGQLATYLRSRGARDEMLVPLCVGRTPIMVVGILGILRAGVAYVPVDPAYPEDRIAYMLEDAGARMVLTTQVDRARLTDTRNLEVIELDSLWAIGDLPEAGTLPRIQPAQLAYVMYTSGSTGKPKGVMIEHRSVHTFIGWCREEFAGSDFSVLFAGTSICFDLSIYEIFYPLSEGKRIRLLDHGMEISRYVSEETGILLNTVPSVVHSLLKDEVDLSHVNVLNMCGEPVPLPVHLGLAAEEERMEVRNFYGPTEDTVYSTVYRLRKGSPIWIGKPLANTSVYIVSPDDQLCPTGVIGELCISGEGLARGYFRKPELTAGKFVNNPFAHKHSAQMYRTGDLARWMPDGNLEFLGRNDQQVKIRGHRIELGEIEHVLQQQEGVVHAVVLARQDAAGDKYLVGYVIPRAGWSREDAVAHLKTRLPEYMVPEVWTEMEEFPLTPNGKVNRKALPDPLPASANEQSSYAAPRNTTEKLLAELWQSLLGIERVGVHDNFFALGGNSMQTMRLIAGVRKRLHAEVTVRIVFEHPTVEALAAFIARTQPGKERRRVVGSRSIIPIQSGGSRTPVFAIPGYFFYRRLSHHLGKDRPFYGFEPSTQTSIADIADHYIREIRSVRPRGPYLLAGYCGHTSVIYEMAHRLREQGEDVPVLILFEAYSPEAWIPKKSWAYVRQKLGSYVGVLRRRTFVPAIRFFAAEIGKTLKVGNNLAAPAQGELEPYEFKPYAGKVALFRASYRTVGTTDDPWMGWRDYLTGKVEIHTIEGDHEGIFEDPDVVQLAKKLDDVFKDVDRS